MLLTQAMLEQHFLHGSNSQSNIIPFKPGQEAMWDYAANVPKHGDLTVPDFYRVLLMNYWECRKKRDFLKDWNQKRTPGVKSFLFYKRKILKSLL